MDDSSDIVRLLISNYKKMKSIYKKKYVSDHWNVYDKSYEYHITKSANWNKFRISGLTCGIETGILLTDRIDVIEGRKEIEQMYSNDTDIQHIHNRVDQLIKIISDFDFIIDNSECNVGCPQYTIYKNVKFNFDDIYMIYHIYQLKTYASLLNINPDIVIEIGGGYGNFAHKVLKNYKCKYIIFDLPESLLLQQYYLSNVANHKILTVDDFDLSNINDINEKLNNNMYDVALLPCWLMNDLTIKHDIVINMRSFGEIDKEIVKQYFDFIHQNLINDGLFYCVNRYVTNRNKEPNRFRDYPFDDNWNFILSQPQWLQTHLHELIAQRSNNVLIKPNVYLNTLPIETPPPGPIMKDISLTTWLTNNQIN